MHDDEAILRGMGRSVADGIASAFASLTSRNDGVNAVWDAGTELLSHFY
jgi:hypothetical protein